MRLGLLVLLAVACEATAPSIGVAGHTACVDSASYVFHLPGYQHITLVQNTGDTYCLTYDSTLVLVSDSGYWAWFRTVDSSVSPPTDTVILDYFLLPSGVGAYTHTDSLRYRFAEPAWAPWFWENATHSLPKHERSVTHMVRGNEYGSDTLRFTWSWR